MKKHSGNDTEPLGTHKKRQKYLRWFFCLILVGFVAVLYLNRQWFYDYYRGITYQPTADMEELRSNLGLTERGKFLFNASQPELNNDENFNIHCRDEGEDTAILGCYTEDTIYIYDIRDEELAGIREVTTAHELLHAVFARMSADEIEKLRNALNIVYEQNKSVFDDDLEAYEEAERFEELYVRSGTEIKDLPEILETHYASIFESQDTIAGYYDMYNKVFREIAADLGRLTEEMKAIDAEIEQKTNDYEKRVGQLDANIISFNSCADTEGCFKSDAEFYARRAILVGEQSALNVMYDEINNLIDQYNEKVEQYNNDVLHNQKLNSMMNSSTKVKEME